jgi:hypothetical protein
MLMVDGSMSGSFSSRARRLVLASCAVLVGALVLSGAPALASGGELPTVEDVTATKVYEHEGTIEAQIDPQGSETTYEIWLECRGPHEPIWPCVQRVEGHLAAGFEAETVSLHLTGLQEGTYYVFGVVAVNSAGQTKERGVSILQDPVIPPGACPDGCSTSEPYRPEPPSQASLESAQREAERITARTDAERQQQARAHEEQKAREAARLAVEEAELKRAEEQEAARDAVLHVLPACVVPSLKGDTLSAARRALGRAHCGLGKVTGPRAHHGALVVIAQSAEHGKKLPGGAHIAVTIGPAPRRHG